MGLDPLNITSFGESLPDAIYWPFKRLPESKLDAYAVACIETALKYSEDARTIYARIIRSWELPGCQALINDFSQHKQDTRAWLRDRAKAVVSNQPLPDWPNGWNDVFAKAKDNTDFSKLRKYAADFLLNAFNRKIDLDNRTLKVLPGKSPYLGQAIVSHSLLDYLEIRPELKGPRVIPDSELTDVLCFCHTLTNNSTTRKERRAKHRIVLTLRCQDFTLHHYQTILDEVEMWYRARVSCNTAREAANYYNIDPEDLSKRIETCDDATGWPRHK